MDHIILLHGALGATDQLQSLANTLKNDFHVHPINFSGHGGNPFSSKPFSIELFSQDVLDYLEQHQIDSAVVFGYSMGGYVGMYLAKYFPAKISRLITLATKFHWDKKTAEREMKMLDADTILQKIPAFAKELEMRHAPGDWKQVLHHTKQLLSDLGADNKLKLAVYASISTPCLVMLGDRDKMVTLEETVDVYKQLPNGSLAVLPQTPHPIEKVDPALVTSFIRRFVQQ